MKGTHYCFDVHNGNGLTLDEEGQVATSIAEARQIAIDGIRSIVREEAGSGILDLRGKIDVRHGREDTVFTVAFTDAFELLLPDEGP